MKAEDFKELDKMMSNILIPGYYEQTCPECKGKCRILTKEMLSIPCIECGGNGYIKYHNKKGRR